MEQETKKGKNVLENGTYSVYGPESGEINFETLELHSGSGAKRIWKVRSMTEKEMKPYLEHYERVSKLSRNKN